MIPVSEIRWLVFAAFLLTVSVSAFADDMPPLAADSPLAEARDSGTASPSEFRSLDEDVQVLKKEVLDLNRDLFVLEEQLLFPANSQVVFFVSMDVGEYFALDSVQLKINGKEVADYRYTEHEAGALVRGGVHRLHMANLETGRHELVAVFTGSGPNARDYRRGATLNFAKGIGAKYMELKIIDRAAKQQPEFLIRQWE